MWKVAVLMHILGMTMLMGTLVLVVASIPSLAEQGMRLIPAAAAVGFFAAIPPSIWAARKILAATSGK